MRYLKRYKIFESFEGYGDIVSNLEDIILDVNENCPLWFGIVKPWTGGRITVSFESNDQDEDYEDLESWQKMSDLYSTNGQMPDPILIEVIKRMINYMESEGWKDWSLKVFDLGNYEDQKNLKPEELSRLEISSNEVISLRFNR